MKISQKGFSAVIVLLSIITIAVVGFAGYYVYNSQKQQSGSAVKVDDASLQQDTANTAVTKDNLATIDKKQETETLVIKEWGVQIPLSVKLVGATYAMDENLDDWLSLLVSLKGDDTGSCSEQAVLSRHKKEDITADSFAASRIDEASYVDGYYYVISGSDSACTENNELQSRATDVRAMWLEQRKNIVSL